MKLQELYDCIGSQLKIMPRAGEADVCIEVELPGAIGGTPVVPVASAGLGIDWNDGKYILRTETSLTMNERKMALIFKMMSNARRLAKKSLEKYTNAQLYAEMVGTRASTAHVKCNEFGVDPENREVRKSIVQALDNSLDG